METPQGLMLLDGHLRQELDAEEEWDVAILDLSAEEQALFLAFFDPSAAMAETDAKKLAELYAQIETESPDRVPARLPGRWHR